MFGGVMDHLRQARAKTLDASPSAGNLVNRYNSGTTYALKLGGTLIISVPHLSRQHELPHDNFRVTPNGLRHLLEDTGFENISIAPFGGVLTFVHHKLSTLILSLAAGFGALFRPVALVNALFSIVSAHLVALVGRSGLLAAGFIAVARSRTDG